MKKLKDTHNKLKLKPPFKPHMIKDQDLLWLTQPKVLLIYMFHQMLLLMLQCQMLLEMEDKCGTKMINSKKLNVLFQIDVILLSIKPLLKIAKLMDNSTIIQQDMSQMLV